MVQEHLRRSEELSQKFEKLANKAVRSIKMTAPKQIIEERAKVVRVEGNTAYVHLAGGVDETPVQMTINAEVNDDVLIKRVNGKAWIAGNVTAPPTDDKVAKRADQKANDTYRFTSEVNEKAENAQKIARDGAQYFWFLEEAGDVPTGVGTGAHISEIPKEEFLADPTNGGGNLLARSNGVAVRDGLTELASFGATGAQIGKTSEGHINIESDEVNFYNGEKALCSFSAGGGSSNSLTNIWTKGGRMLDIASIDFDADPVGIGDILLYPSTISMTARRANNSKEARLTLQVATDFSTRIALTADKVMVNGYTLDNFVLSHGTSGSWKYEKWNSGKVEAWGTILFSTLTFSARGSLYRSVNNAFSIPSGIFAGAPTHGDAFIMGANMDYISATVGSLSDTGGSCEVWKATSGDGSNIYVHIHLVYIP